MNFSTTFGPMIMNPLMGVVVPAIALSIAARVRSRATTSRDLKQLREDLELLETVPQRFAMRQHLEASIEDRLLNYSYRGLFNSALRSIVLFSLGVLLFLCLQVALIFTAHSGDPIGIMTRYWAIALGAVVVVELVVFVGLAYDVRTTNGRRSTYFSDGTYPNRFENSGKPLLPALRRSVRYLRRMLNLGAARPVGSRAVRRDFQA